MSMTMLKTVHQYLPKLHGTVYSIQILIIGGERKSNRNMAVTVAIMYARNKNSFIFFYANKKMVCYTMGKKMTIHHSLTEANTLKGTKFYILDRHSKQGKTFEKPQEMDEGYVEVLEKFPQMSGFLFKNGNGHLIVVRRSDTTIEAHRDGEFTDETYYEMQVWPIVVKEELVNEDRAMLRIEQFEKQKQHNLLSRFLEIRKRTETLAPSLASVRDSFFNSSSTKINAILDTLDSCTDRKCLAENRATFGKLSQLEIRAAEILTEIENLVTEFEHLEKKLDTI